jgi:hypothetical protein
MRIVIRVVLLASVLASVAASAAEFSADIVSRDASGAAIGTGGRLYAANGKVRIETTDAAAGFFLVDGATTTSLFVRPQQRVFMDARQSTRLTRIFLPLDPGSPCAQWQAAAQASGLPSAGGDWHCERKENSSVNGRETLEYSVTSSANEAATQGWIAPDLGFPVKWRAADGTTFTLEHIRVERQPAELFAVPADYRKLDPQALIERIKHSDVWAAPPQ